MAGKGNYADANEDKRGGRKSSKKELPAEPKFSWCNVSLSERDKDTIKSQSFDAVRVFEFIERMVLDGYKITTSYDQKSDSILVVVVGRDESRSDYNIGVSSRHTTAEVAWLTTIYKFDVLFMGGAIPSDLFKNVDSVWD